MRREVKDHKGLRVRREIKDHKGLRVRREVKDHKCLRGRRGIKGLQGPQGPQGETLPLNIILAAAGDKTSDQPLVISPDGPVHVIVYGSGFNEGEELRVELVGSNGLVIAGFSRVEGLNFVGLAGAFSSTWTTASPVAEGLYSVEVTSMPSNTKASSALVVAEK